LDKKIDKVGGKAKKSLSSLKLNKDKRNLDSLPEENPWDKDGANLDPGVNSDEEEDIDAIFKKVGGSSLSLNRKPLENTKNSPLPPSKPQRSLGVYQNENGGGKITPGKGKATVEENLPLEIINKFNGKSREDLIRMVVTVQNTVESQGKKITDLEAYIDTLLSRVIEVAPVLLHKDLKGGNRSNGMQVFNRDLKRSKFG